MAAVDRFFLLCLMDRMNVLLLVVGILSLEVVDHAAFLVDRIVKGLILLILVICDDIG